MKRDTSNGSCVNPHRALADLRERVRWAEGDPSFVERVMGMVLNRELETLRLIQRAARRCVLVCSVLVLLAVWWARQSRDLVPFAYAVTDSPLEAPW